MADVFLAEALDEKKESCIYHRYLDTNKYNTERHWWVLCEALEGLGNAFELTHDEKYRKPIVPFWNYISEHIIDTKIGEWHWCVDENKEPLQQQPKLSNWKAPYHNSRALMRLIEKMDKW
ncbi:MAG: AGE family epimerase/isomerase [Bacteroidales bacterium]|nr:AGE family epimerase/isomerase [Bacteroidales bacterium]